MGGTPAPPKTYSPQEQALAQIQIDNAAAERTRAAQAAEQARKDQERREGITRTADKTNQLFTQGQTIGGQRAQNMGFDDTYGLLDTYNNMLSAQRMQVPDISENPGSYFDFNSLWDKSVNQVQSGQQTRLDNEFRSKTPVGWQNNYFADTADDSILDAILGEQYGSAFDTVDAARARGQLSQGGFDNTLRMLDQKKLGARSTLEDMGLGVLGGYRDELTNLSKQFGDKVTNYKLGQQLNLDDFTTAAQSRAGELGNRMRGDIYRAVGDTSLFNVDSLMARGGSQAGVSNSPLRNAFRDPSITDPTRTTGTTGVF